MGGIGGIWRRLRAKMVRDPLPPESVAAGWALGVFIGCAVPFGLQLVVAIPLAVMMRVSKIGATVGTFITNPVTIIFIYPAQTWIAFKMLFGGREIGAMPSEWSREAVLSLSGPVVMSYFIGGLLLAAVLTPAVYFTVRAIVVKYRRIRRRCAVDMV